MQRKYVRLLYGRQGLDVRLPDSARPTLIEKLEMPVCLDPADAVRQALDQPVGAPHWAATAGGARTACIAICDITRPVPNHLFLRPLIERLMQAGVPASGIIVLVATGLHRPNEGAELAELIGDPWVLSQVAVENHDARDDAMHILLGRTPTRGTVVRLDRRFVQADLRIATGLVEPHFMAGYSGGRKVIAPGLAHAETITTFHNARFMSDPAAVNCNFHNNPLHEEQLQIVKMLGGAYAVNTVIDDQRRLALVNFGEIVASHEQAVEFARRYCEVSVDRRYSTVVTTSAGYPLDKTYYQTVKGMVAAMDILAPGGDLIVASECSEGLGSPEFVASQRRLLQAGPAAFLDEIQRRAHARIDEWQTQMQLKPMSVGRVHLFSEGLSEQDHEATGVARIESISDAVQRSIQRHQDPEVAVIPEGPYLIPSTQ